MKITKDHIGDVICIYATGQRMTIKDISKQFLYYDLENGLSRRTPCFVFPGGVERDPLRVERFRENHDLAKVLEAAEIAAMQRRLPGHADEKERAEAGQVLKMAEEQLAVLKQRLQLERETIKAGSALAEQFLDDLNQQEEENEGIFFGVSVSRLDDGTEYEINGTHVASREEAIHLLSGLTPEGRSASTLESRLSSANERAVQKSTDSPLISQNICR